MKTRRAVDMFHLANAEDVREISHHWYLYRELLGSVNNSVLIVHPVSIYKKESFKNSIGYVLGCPSYRVY